MWYRENNRFSFLISFAATGIEKIRQEEPVDKTKHWGDLEREEEKEEPMEGKDLEDGIESVDSLSSTPTGNEKPDVIDLHKQQRKEPERPLYQVRKHIKWMLLQPEELEAMENVLPEKYEQARGQKKLRSQREDFSDMVAESKKRKRKMSYMRDLSSIKFCKKPSRLQVTVTRIAGK